MTWIHQPGTIIGLIYLEKKCKKSINVVKEQHNTVKCVKNHRATKRPLY